MKIPQANWNDPESWFHMVLILSSLIMLLAWIWSWLWYVFAR